MRTDINIAKDCLNELSNYPKYEEIVNRGIFIEEEIDEHAILFIGINPSFDKDNDPIPGDKKYFPTYVADSKGYFKKPKEIADKNMLAFAHHDLFVIRERAQDVIKKMFIVNDNNITASTKEKGFIDKCLRHSEQVITKTQPQIIIVINAFASDIIQNYVFDGHHFLNYQRNHKERWNPKLGVDFVPINGKNTPIVFSGMLSGQRALDKHSEFRLEWHINHILTHREEWPK